MLEAQELPVAAMDAASPRRRRLPAMPWILAGVIDLAALWLLATHVGSLRAAVVAGGLHLGALLPVLVAGTLTPSEKMLGGAFVLVLPAAGVALAALSLGTSGESDLDRGPPVDPVGFAEPQRVDELRRLGEALPCCEALISGTQEERRAIIATLTRRADGNAVALLRWALGAPDPELAVEAALAIEEMTAAFEARLAECRAEVAAAPASAEAALACAELVTQAIDAGIADSALVSKLAHEARRQFIAADDGEPSRVLAVALGRARLELDVLRPDTALACIDDALERVGPDGRPALLALREEAVLASHALPWEGPSALATYQHPALAPPPLTARRRYGTGRALGVRGGTGGVTIGPVQIPPLASTHKVRRDGR